MSGDLWDDREVAPYQTTGRQWVLGFIGLIILTIFLSGIAGVSHSVFERGAQSVKKEDASVVTTGPFENLKKLPWRNYHHDGHVFMMHTGDNVVHHPGCPCQNETTLEEFVDAAK